MTTINVCHRILKVDELAFLGSERIAEQLNKAVFCAAISACSSDYSWHNDTSQLFYFQEPDTFLQAAALITFVNAGGFAFVPGDPFVVSNTVKNFQDISHFLNAVAFQVFLHFFL